ncbi:MAG: hypothetical protein HYS98_08415 [Deltaproteobacteria bacterium]|nr:hypothetical protein [Deltaproteobacteria bacterium]
MKLNAKFGTLSFFILVAALSRLLPHPPNFTPILSMGLFAGAHFENKKGTFIVLLGSMLLSDLFLGFHSTLPAIYAILGLITVLGFWLRNKTSITKIVVSSILASAVFFVLSNFAVWAMGSYYPKTWVGIVECYTLAIPFFGNTLASTLLYSAAIFGAYQLCEKLFLSKFRLAK